MLLISDANVLIDMEVGGLMKWLFRLPMQFALPDILYWEEIVPGTLELKDPGLRILEVTGESIQYASALRGRYANAPGLNDCLALALAKQEGCPLLTGDPDLKAVAQAERVPVKGSDWLLLTMVENELLNVDEAFAALASMKQGMRRLPWADTERVLSGLRQSAGKPRTAAD
ncbi:PIN domain-containing protein [Verminephrobacter aporrectodeae]|uniref:Type II toxin-antitoxin system VapC family toxin n=1 Tax=Verminephrobacter aporrectodeae subsp. tuberculatae TaxID=1110392 RepID=A0ABT3KW92_9BURK|nr:PIN domain-containing protein [Verminephrobacter aporrectodeae]MCW5223023.1 type II toxin-antitoxin system VapC family toxin [Verminephrobacter aporrectodeae subsp. tuberculatae]MCW5256762.1 type II toxin-antitoxin system VapC family toxin [Verminephrobacter aporrectodeae subsp. tuberculatae]MCW5288487.1 type II toxin-antitoxin system VapC family toxin [Verminephrobacter aporrectodeae subsp. tuberculatae]MCW5322070.1 type II toxin-antitoxin system VapC family toxin [Verminephrobacter aporrec